MRTAREKAMLAEMGVGWPALLPEPGGRQTSADAGLQAADSVATPAVGTAGSAGAADAVGAPGAAAPRGGEGRPQAFAPAPSTAPASGPAQTLHALPAAVAQDWGALQQEVSACARCGLCRTRRRTVFGVGAERATWMVVGEAPGEQEDLQGAPFVGAAGQLLDRMLEALSLSRDPGAGQVFITNTVKCRPPQNRNPQPEELAACAPYLQAQLAHVRPRIVLAMGRFAAQRLLGSEEPIGRLRGKVHAMEQADGTTVPVVVTYHPAYLLRNPADKGKAWSDLCLAQAVLSRT